MSDSDFPDFDAAYLKTMLPENPDQFDILAAKANFGIYQHDLWRGTGRRFAESIVRECIRACPHDDGRKHIKKHFGLDE